MRFEVPQFIEIEDKIFGPFTFKQFAYLAGATGALVVSKYFLPWILAVPVAAPFVGLGLALAFYKINDRPFIDVLQSAFEYSLKSKLYLWQHRAGRQITETPADIARADGRAKANVPLFSENKLKDLAWSLDINDTSNNAASSMNLQ